ncbi:hypothetical protein Tco_1403340 [Tanacetum coccineum]
MRNMDRYRKQEIVNLLHDIDIKIDSGVATETKREDCVKLIQEFDDIDISESMVTWVTEGDKNMKLFHGMVNQRRRNQYVQGILINSVWISDPQHVKAAFLEFYHDKFKAQTTRVNFDLNGGGGFENVYIRLVLLFWLMVVQLPNSLENAPQVCTYHIFYADNVVMLTKWNQNEIVNIIGVFDELYQIPGLKFNIQKSNVNGIEVSKEEIEAMSRLTVNGVWANIVGSFNTLHSSGIVANGTLKCKVGDGASVRFWKDTWLSDEPLYIRYNRLFRLDSNVECLIKERLVNGSWSWCWKRSISSGRTRSSLTQLMDEVSHFHHFHVTFLIYGNG